MTGTKKTLRLTLSTADRDTLIQRMKAEQLDIHYAWSDGVMWLQLCDHEGRRSYEGFDNPTFTERERRYKADLAAFEEQLTPELRETFGDLESVAMDLRALEQRTAFELGKDLGGAVMHRRPVFDRVIDAVRNFASAGTDYNAQSVIDHLSAALPIAKEILLTADAFDSTSDPIERHIRLATSGAEDMAQPGKERDAVFFVAVAIGLLLAESV